jgi:hypothetical protein
MTTASVSLMTDVYPFPAIRATKIARMSEQSIGDFQLTAEIVAQLSEDEIGVLVGNCGSMERIHEKLRDLADTEYPSPFVVVLQSKKMAAIWYNEQAAIFGWKAVAPSTPPAFWKRGCCFFATMEGLQKLANSGELRAPVAAMLMVDPYLTTHKCRGYSGNGWGEAHDRPQLVLNFRTVAEENGVFPPLVFFAVPPAKSLNTKPVESVYGLATWWYADGKFLRVGQPPVI